MESVGGDRWTPTQTKIQGGEKYLLKASFMNLSFAMGGQEWQVKELLRMAVLAIPSNSLTVRGEKRHNGCAPVAERRQICGESQ